GFRSTNSRITCHGLRPRCEGARNRQESERETGRESGIKLPLRVTSMTRRVNVTLLGVGALLAVAAGGFSVSRLPTSPVSAHAISLGTNAPSPATAALPPAPA